jgi:hypothetical protein
MSRNWSNFWESLQVEINLNGPQKQMKKSTHNCHPSPLRI